MKHMLLAATFALTLGLLGPASAQDDHQIVGVWKMKSFVRKEVATGTVSKPFGENPNGLQIFTPGGYFSYGLYAEGRKSPASERITDEESIMLRKTMVAYHVTYKVEGGKLFQTLTGTWNQLWDGQTQVRNMDLKGKTVTLTSQLKAPDGKEYVFTVAFERVE